MSQLSPSLNVRPTRRGYRSSCSTGITSHGAARSEWRRSLSGEWGLDDWTTRSRRQRKPVAVGVTVDSTSCSTGGHCNTTLSAMTTTGDFYTTPVTAMMTTTTRRHLMTPMMTTPTCRLQVQTTPVTITKPTLYVAASDA